jgi:SAM-dependent methyltransferase
MSHAPPRIFDYARLRSRIDRARRIAAPDAGFLAGIAANELADRLRVTNREFRNAADLYSTTAHISRLLATSRPGISVTKWRDEEGSGNRDELGGPRESYDLAVSVFGLHWCNDLPGTLRQIADLLQPDGLFLATVPGEGTLNELRASMLAVESAMSGGAAMRVDPFTDIRQAGALLQRAGFALPVTDCDQLTLRYSNVRSLIAELRAMGGTSALTGTVRALPRGFLDALEARYRSQYCDPDGKIRVTVNLVHMTAWKPHEGQQKPLEPGSARTSLASVLKSKI